MFHHVRQKQLPTIVLVFLLISCIGISLNIGVSAKSIKQAYGSGILPGSMLAAGGKARTTVVQSPQLQAAKLSGTIRTLLPHNHTLSAAGHSGQPPAAYLLNTSYADHIYEPAGSGTDASGKSYTDWYFAEFCGPGAATVSLDYWNNVNTRALGLNQYSTPHSTTSWNDGINGARDTAYLMYLATKVYPPSFTSAGMMTWSSYPTATTYVQDITDAMNWEASNHGAYTNDWRNYFYTIVWSPSLTTIKADVAADIYKIGVAPVVVLNDASLPDWQYSPSKGHGHYVAIIGYDNNAGTFTYEETCGSYNCGTSGSGRYTVSQQKLLDGITSYGGALVW